MSSTGEVGDGPSKAGTSVDTPPAGEIPGLPVASGPPPAPPTAEPASTAAPAPPEDEAPWRRRTWPRRLLIGANIIVAIALIASAGAYGYIRWRVGQINSVALPSLSPMAPTIEGTPGPPETILIVGSDSRAGNKGGDATAFGPAALVAGQRSDTIMLLRVDPATNRAALMSIPRDLFVHIPRTQIRDRINTTFNDGPDLLVQAIHDDLGIQINHYVEVDFQSFRGMVDAINGVKVYFPTPARDFYSGLDIRAAGCYTLSGAAALAYVRARHYQYYEQGYWHFEADSDLARIRRQQDFVRKVVTKSVHSGLTDPSRLNGVVSAVVGNLTVDTALKNNQGDLLRVLRMFKRMGGDAGLATMTLPTDAVVIGGADVLVEQQFQGDLTIRDFLNGPPPPSAPATTSTPGAATAPAVSPGDVHVRVLNGSGVTGQATAASSALTKAGFAVLGAASADSFKHATSLIRYALGQENKAVALQAYVLGGATIQPDSSLHGTDVVLVTGSTYAGISPISPAVASAPVTGTPTTPTSTSTTPPPVPGGAANAPLPACN